MALKIRHARGGAKRRPFYRVVVAENTSPRDGRFVERLGSYNPLLPQGHTDRIVIDKDRAAHWLKVGAQPTERVHHFLAQMGLIKDLPQAVRPQQATPKKKAQERLKEAAAALAARAEAEAAPKASAEPSPAAAESVATEANPAEEPSAE